MEIIKGKNHNGDSNMISENITIGQTLEAVDKQIKIESNTILKYALSQLRIGYINELNQYFYNLFDAIFKFIIKDTDQTIDDLETIYEYQRRIIFLYKNGDLKYYIKHFYHKNDILNWVKDNNKAIDVNTDIFGMHIIISENKLYNALKKYAKSDIAKKMLQK